MWRVNGPTNRRSNHARDFRFAPQHRTPFRRPLLKRQPEFFFVNRRWERRAQLRLDGGNLPVPVCTLGATVAAGIPAAMLSSRLSRSCSSEAPPQTVQAAPR